MRIIFTGGGTGGHIYPAIAIARGLSARISNCQVLFVGTESGLESRVVPREGFAFRCINIEGINRRSMLTVGNSMAKFPKSFFQAWQIIKEFQPDVVFGTGGYVSYPVVLAGTFFAPRTIIHEQNVYPGLANRLLARKANYTLLTFAEAEQYLKARKIKVTGLPVREEFSHPQPLRLRQTLGFAHDIFTLMVFGGSAGAESINRAMLQAIEFFGDRKIQVIWITGNDKYEVIAAAVADMNLDDTGCRIQIFPYMHNIEDAFALSDLALCRAGAGTLSELAIIGLPAILVPYPYASENHQEKNARALLKQQAAEMIIDEFLDGMTLYQKVAQFMDSREKLESMRQNIKKEARPNALHEILDTIMATD